MLIFPKNIALATKPRFDVKGTRENVYGNARLGAEGNSLRENPSKWYYLNQIICYKSQAFLFQAKSSTTNRTRKSEIIFTK